MKKFGVVLCLCWMIGLSVKAADPSLMRIGGRTIPVSEFKWYLNQSDQFSKDNGKTYFQYFLNYQLKVADARSRQLDTLPDFRRQCELMQAHVLKEHFTNHRLADSYYRRWSDQQTARLQVRDWVKMEILTYRLSQHPTPSEEGVAVRVMDELYERLQRKGSSVDENRAWAKAKSVNIDSEGKRWIPVNSLLNEMIERQSTLRKGTYSLPFYSPLGIHIIRLLDRRDTADNAETYSQMNTYMNGLGKASPLFDLDAFNLWKAGKSVLPAEVQFQMKQIHDGLLAMYWDKYFSKIEKKSVSRRELERFYLSHKDDYRWEYPHFKGAVVHCLNKKAASKIKKRLKKYPMELWEEALERMQRENSKYRGELECGLFQIGKNAYVDRLAFKCGQMTPHKEYPYTFVIGKKLKDGPEHYSDVLQEVLADYRSQHENDCFSELFFRFKVEINEDVLKSVNSCGNK